MHARFSVDPVAISPFRTVREIAESTATTPGHQAMAKMACFVSQKLASKHADLGRAGPVCPFARRGAASGGIRFADCTAGPDDEAQITGLMTKVRDEFLEWGEKSGIPPMLRAYVVTFSALGGAKDAAMIENVQKRLKPDYVERGLMIGQFYPGCEESGIRNPDFRPLDAPVISLAVRFMALADAPFMLGDAQFRAAFVARHGAAGERELALAEQARPAAAG
ncbi:DUF6875 domain-containing protein [Croceicoccus sp. Ery5]|uniref:DUF6875 domain-containing protein n=1 Tax=Croceicoccus sp. Ery5 TaxID=1703340 RepID=UPI00351D463A